MMGWAAYRGAPEPLRRSFPDLASADRSSPVVGVGALCELRPPRPKVERAQGFQISEFVQLANGNRVLLHHERGCTIGVSGTDPIQKMMSAESIISSVLVAVLPDDEESVQEHPWSWLAELAQARGLSVTADQLKGLPYEVVLADSVTQWLSHD